MRDLQSAALLASIAAPFDLAAEFLSTAGPGPWAERFELWATERQLAPELRQAVRRAILRRRNFGGAEPRPHGRKRARRG